MANPTLRYLGSDGDSSGLTRTISSPRRLLLSVLYDANGIGMVYRFAALHRGAPGLLGLGFRRGARFGARPTTASCGIGIVTAAPTVKTSALAIEETGQPTSMT